ncbi:hypothetical protein STVA_18300 [Allostella vacuolata]|nr:hypothetical protein STVA_18300 [Stella vacuolata]
MPVDRDMPTLRKVEASEGWTLKLWFEGEDRPYFADLAGLLARSRPMAALRDRPERFGQVRIIMAGAGVQWPVEYEGELLDLSADTLFRIAEEQEPMTGADFAAWRKELGLSTAMAAAVLGIGRRTVVDYENKPVLPAMAAIACRTLARDRTTLAAHFVPSKRLGRPKKAA